MNINSIGGSAGSSVIYNPVKRSDQVNTPENSKPAVAGQSDSDKSKLQSGRADNNVIGAGIPVSSEAIAAQLDGPFPRLRLQGQAGSPGDQRGANSGAGLNNINSPVLSASFNVADSNQDDQGSQTEQPASARINASFSDTPSTRVSSGNQASNESEAQDSNEKLKKQSVQLTQAYGGFGDDTGSSGISVSA